MEEIHAEIYQAVQTADGMNIVYIPTPNGFLLQNNRIHATFDATRKIPLTTAYFDYNYGILPKPGACNLYDDRGFDWITPLGLKKIVRGKQFPIRFSHKYIHDPRYLSTGQWQIAETGNCFHHGDWKWYCPMKIWRFELPHPIMQCYLWNEPYSCCYEEQKGQLDLMSVEPNIVMAWLKFFLEQDPYGRLKYKLIVDKSNAYRFAQLEFWIVLVGEKYAYCESLSTLLPFKSVGYCDLCKQVVIVKSSYAKEIEDECCKPENAQYDDEEERTKMITVECKEMHQPSFLIKLNQEDRTKCLLIYRDFTYHLHKPYERVTEKCAD